MIHGPDHHKLAQLHPDLATILEEVAKAWNVRIMCAHRDQAEQRKAFESKHSKVDWPNSKHNRMPSEAVDALPMPVDWHDTGRLREFGGYVRATAFLLREIGRIAHEIRWGGDWGGDTTPDKFQHLAHFELINPQA